MKTMMVHQMLLEKLFDKNQTLTRIGEEFRNCKEVDFVGYMNQEGIDPDFGIAVLTQMALHKRADLPTLLGTVRGYFNTAQQVADQLLLCAEKDLIDWDPQLKIFIVRFGISEEVQLELDRFSYPLPMVVKPVMLTSNKQSAYLGKDYSVILKNNHHDNDVCLDHLNRINRIPFSFNMNTAEMVKNSWRNLDKPKEGETKEDFEKRVRAFNKYDKHSREIMELLTKEGNMFYFTHRYDKRGRTYCQGHHATYQGTPWNKAVLEFFDKEVITDEF